MSDRAYTIGFANLSETHLFAIRVRQGLEKAAAAYPNVNLIIRDNRTDDAVALANIEEFARLPVDLAIIYHIGERIGPKLSATLLKKHIKMIAVDIPIPPWAVYFGVNNQESGAIVGRELAAWINRHWQGQVDKVLVLTESRVPDFVRTRSTAALNSLTQGLGYMPPDVMYLEAGNDRIPSARVVSGVLQRWPDAHHVAVIGFNDETAMGALDAARQLDRAADVIAVGQGGNLAAHELQDPHTRLVASVAYYPDQYGQRLLDLALRMLNGERVERAHFIRHQPITRETVV